MMESNLPENWELVKLVEHLEFLPTGVKEFAGKKKYYSTGSIQDKNFLPEGEFTFQDRPSRANRISSLGDVFQARMKGTDKDVLIDEKLVGQLFSTGFIQIRPYGETYNRKLLYYFLKSDFFLSQKDELATGSTQEALTDNKAAEIEIPLPPLPEQHRIVAKLDALMQKVESNKQCLEKIPVILKRFRQSVLAAAVSGRLTEDWREKYNEVESGKVLILRIKEKRIKRYDEACKVAKKEGKRKPSNFDNYDVNLRNDFELFEIPNSWRWVDFRFVMTEDEPFCYGVVQPGSESNDGNYLIRAGDIKNNTVDTSSLRTISKTVDKKYSRSKVNGGELLITVVGAGIGECCIIPNKCKGYNIARAVAKVPIKDFNTKFVLYWLNNSIANKWMKTEAREVARPTLNLEQLKTIPLPVSSIEEQKEIVRRVEQLFDFADKIEARYTKARAMLDKLPQSILAKAFRGELVAQDPNDEPAERLLERIKSKKGNRV
jgi:type I restriction enzyme S subunit